MASAIHFKKLNCYLWRVDYVLSFFFMLIYFDELLAKRAHEHENRSPFRHPSSPGEQGPKRNPGPTPFAGGCPLSCGRLYLSCSCGFSQLEELSRGLWKHGSY